MDVVNSGVVHEDHLHGQVETPTTHGCYPELIEWIPDAGEAV